VTIKMLMNTIRKKIEKIRDGEEYNQDIIFGMEEIEAIVKNFFEKKEVSE